MARNTIGAGANKKAGDRPLYPFPRILPPVIYIYVSFFFVSRTATMPFTAPRHPIDYYTPPSSGRALETRHFLLFFLMSVDCQVVL